MVWLKKKDKSIIVIGNEYLIICLMRSVRQAYDGRPCVCGFSDSYSLGAEADIDHVCLNYSGGNSVGVFPRVTEVGFYWICLSLNRGFLSAEEPTSELCFILQQLCVCAFP